MVLNYGQIFIVKKMNFICKDCKLKLSDGEKISCIKSQAGYFCCPKCGTFHTIVSDIVVQAYQVQEIINDLYQKSED